jgi:biopolymer transport protein ExbD
MASKRKISEVDASSIADIAFILLAFIIVVTTLQEEEGIPAVLPQKRDIDNPTPPIIKKKNIFEILVNKDNQLMIENQWDKSLDDIKPMVMEFMTNPKNSKDLPELVEVNQAICQQQINLLTKLVEGGDTDKQKKLEEWNDKLAAVKLLGPYKTLPKSATIAIQYDKGTSYGTYLGVRDEIMSGINELRDEKCLEAFNISYKALENLRAEVKTEEDKDKINAIREVYPQKIIKLPARNVQ